MKVRTLSLAAGAATFIATTPATATLTGIVVAAEPQEPDLVVCRVYARFNKPDDHLVAVWGTAASPLEVSVTGGGFYQHPFGSDTAPHEVLLATFPSLAWDTFVTIGLGANSGDDNTLLMPPWPGFGPSTLATSDSGWFITPSDAQGAPDADGHVLLGQFTYDGTAIEGRMLVQFITGGVHMRASVRFCHGTAGPCIDGDLDGNNLVTIDDFLVLLAAWGGVDCPADIDGDGVVGITDFLLLLGNWTVFSVVPTGAGVHADLNGDGVVNIFDLLILLGCQGPAVGDCVVADIDGDGSVGATDLVLLIANWI